MHRNYIYAVISRVALLLMAESLHHHRSVHERQRLHDCFHDYTDKPGLAIMAVAFRQPRDQTPTALTSICTGAMQCFWTLPCAHAMKHLK